MTTKGQPYPSRVPCRFKGKTVQVKGKVKLYRDRPEIAISSPSEIEIVNKK